MQRRHGLRCMGFHVPGDCNNGAQVSVVASDGGSQVDAPVQPDVGGVERSDVGHTGANGAAVTDGGDYPLVTMEPKDPTVEESMPAVDDQSTDPVEGGPFKEMEIAPTGGLLEVDSRLQQGRRSRWPKMKIWWKQGVYKELKKVCQPL